MNNELISVVVPIYNVKDYLKKCISSIKNQTHHNMQIILVDDGSTDGSSIFCDDFAKDDERIIVIHKNNAGLSSARNVGISNSVGEYICFIDSDDYIEEDYIESMLSYAKKNDCDIVCGGHFFLYENGSRVIQKKYGEGIYTRDTALKMLYKYELTDYAWDKLYKRELFSDITYPDNRICEDMATTYKLFYRANLVGTIENVLYNYYQRSNSITKLVSGKRAMDAFISYNERCTFFWNYFGKKDFDTEMELVKLAFYACIAAKDNVNDYGYTTAKKYLVSSKKYPKLSISNILRLFYLKNFVFKYMN